MSNTDLNFEQVKNKFNQLIKLGKEFGDSLITGNKTKKKAVYASLNTPYDDSSEIKALRRSQESDSVLGGSLKEFLKQIFKHYDANPSDDEKNKKILDTYVNENLVVIPYLRKAIPDVVNENDTLYHDINTLIEKIRIDQNINQEKRKIYIVGIRGAGKTSYLNYFRSKYETEFNKNKIINIRINVLRISPNDDLEVAIKFKIIRILFTYYCTWQHNEHGRLINRNIKNDIDKYLLSILKDQHNNYSENDIIECSDYFKNYNAKEPIKIKPDYDRLCDLLLHLVVKDYKFVIMLDNFDQISPNAKEIYENRMEQLQNINTSFFFNHSIYIIAVRYSTFNSIPINTRKASSCRVIGAPTTFDMLNKRIDYFATISRSELKTKKINCFKNLIMLIGNNFIPDKSGINKTVNFEQACNLFDDIFYGNKRIIINMIERFINIIPKDDFDLLCEENCEYNFENIFDRLISQTYYKFFESLLINVETGYCNCFFEYKKENEKYQIYPINPTSHFDENFIPNIYRFPATSHSKDTQFIPFLKIRILQLLVNYKDKEDKLSQNEIAKKLNEIFDYNRDAIHLACEELRRDQSIIIIMKELADDETYNESTRNLKVDITPRGEKTLEIIPVNINLLAVSLEQIYFPVLFLKTGMPIGNYNDTDISKFIIKNMFFTLPKTIGLLRSIEQYEKDNILPRTNKTNQKLFSDADFTITEKLIEIANDSIDKIYRSYFGNENDSDQKFVRRKADLKKQLGIEI